MRPFLAILLAICITGQALARPALLVPVPGHFHTVVPDWRVISPEAQHWLDRGFGEFYWRADAVGHMHDELPPADAAIEAHRASHRGAILSDHVHAGFAPGLVEALHVSPDSETFPGGDKRRFIDLPAHPELRRPAAWILALGIRDRPQPWSVPYFISRTIEPGERPPKR